MASVGFASGSRFGQSTLFGHPSQDPSLNVHYAQLAYQHAQNHPSDPQAQRQWAFWSEVVRQQQAAAQTAPQTAPLQAPLLAQGAAAAPAAHAQAQAPAQAAPQFPLLGSASTTGVHQDMTRYPPWKHIFSLG